MKMPDGQVLLFKADGLTVNVEAKELVLCKNCKHRYDSIFCPMRQEIHMQDLDDLDDTVDEDILVLDETERNGWCYKGEKEE